jgi:hypothetical protein
MITKFGKRFLTGYVAGSNEMSQREIAFGLGSTAATESDTRLEFEFYRIPVSFGVPSIELDGSIYRYYVVYKTTIPQDIAGKINEVAIYPGGKTSFSNFDSKFITDFEDNTLWTDSSGLYPTIYESEGSVYPRIGKYIIKVDTMTSSTIKEYSANLNSFDISGYSVNDTLALAYYKNDNNLDSIKVRLYSSETAYYEAAIVDDPSAGTGHKIASVSLSDMLLGPINSPDSKNISKISIIVESKSSGASVVYLDALRINDEDTFDPNYGMIARSIFTTELEKTAGKQVDIEYKMEIEF